VSVSLDAGKEIGLCSPCIEHGRVAEGRHRPPRVRVSSPQRNQSVSFGVRNATKYQRVGGCKNQCIGGDRERQERDD
jgi:hypothetical protein